MFNILTLNKISDCGTSLFDKDNYIVSDSSDSPDGIMVRSASMHDMEPPSSLLAIARAGAGVNNIPLDKCSAAGIVVFNTPGANANAVKELVIAGLLISSRRVISAVDWAKTLKGKGDEVAKLVEKGKSQFAGPEIKGKALGVIGLGAIGVLVANAAKRLGMEVYGYDPYLSVKAAWGVSSSIHHSSSLEQIYEKCDYITVHVPLTPETKCMLNADAFAMMPEGVRILNFSRAELVNGDDMLAALADGKVAAYVVDFPTDDMLGVENVIAIPHLGASTPESEDNCAEMAAHELIEYLEYGNIINSVNFPTVEVPRTTDTRLCVLHRNIPNMLSRISGLVSATGANIESMANRSKNDYAYTILDVVGDVSDDCIEKIQDIDGVIRVRKIR
ncbi:MAG: phosphoglycerate dehydrogenase [Oscillospiraceae bacterium]|nr:phosphoglycerate dehydrogenase [Oscillospiraceae bacterium]MDD4412976.1 phosphoglycerate dehydrogenase [Oscillospiraceae bacterium]